MSSNLQINYIGAVKSRGVPLGPESSSVPSATFPLKSPEQGKAPERC